MSIAFSKRCGVALALGLAVLPLSAAAGVINGSFETPAAANDGGTAAMAVDPVGQNWNGWNYTSSFALSFAIRNPTNALFTGTTGLATPIPTPGAGVQLAMIQPTTAIFQTLSDTLQAGQAYTVSAAAGRAMADSGSTVELSLWAVNPSNPNGSLAQQIFLGSQSVNTSSPGAIVPVTFSYTAPGSGSSIGQPLIVAVRNIGSSTAHVDNISLISVPEPSTIAAITLVSLAALRRPSRKRQH